MSMNFHRRSHEVPGLNTSSLPDLIFSVLFFFMIVTHMRHVTVKVKYQVPQGKELTRLTKKSAVSYIYIGRPTSAMGKVMGEDSRQQDKRTYPSDMKYLFGRYSMYHFLFAGIFAIAVDDGIHSQAKRQDEERPHQKEEDIGKQRSIKIRILLERHIVAHQEEQSEDQSSQS
jgi:hypothetical protein